MGGSSSLSGLTTICQKRALVNRGIGAMTMLSEEPAFLAMYKFLDAAYQRGCEELGAILGDISLLPDGNTADPAAWPDWISAVKAATDGTVDAQRKLK